MKEPKKRKPAVPVVVHKGQKVVESVVPKYDTPRAPGDNPWEINGKLPHEDELKDYIVGGKRNQPKGTVNSLKDLPNIVQQPVVGISWEEAKELAKKGACIRRSIWPVNQMMFYRHSNKKTLSSGKGLYPPITAELLEKHGCDSLLISGHWNLYNQGWLQVGCIVVREDKDAVDWELYSS